MTDIDLQKAIKQALIDEVFQDMMIFENQEMKIFEYDLPLSSDFDEDEDEDNEPFFPCCIVRIRGGEIKNADEPQLTTIEIIVVVKDVSHDMSGHKNLLIAMHRIRDYFLSGGGIRGKFRIIHPMKWGINEQNTMPYFVGSIITIWQTETQSFQDVENFL